MDKKAELDKVAQEIEKCKICKVKKSGKAVPGEGNPDAQIIFIGEAPGRTEALTGRPFIGRSGKFLRNSIKDAGLREEDVFITSPVKYIPDYITPTEADILHGMIHLSKQLNIIEPEILVLLGSVAVRGVLGEKLKISQDHGKIVKKDGKRYFISYHPAAAIRFTKIRSQFLEDFKKLKKELS